MATYYISPTGNDSTGNGSQGNPWQTISKAHSSASNGDTINCLAGTYTWVYQDIEKALNFVGVSGATATIFDNGNANNVLWDFGSYTSFSGTVNVTGLTFKNVLANFNQAAAFRGESSSSVTVNFTNCIFSALDIAGGTTQAAAIFQTGNGGSYSLSFTGCLFNGCVKSGAGSLTTCAMFYNLSGSIALTLTNCTFYSNSSGNTLPFFTGGGAITATMTNCIFSNASGDNAAFGGGAATFLGSNNDVFGYSSIPSGLSSQSGYISADPLFVDAAANNFSLRPSSPCIDAGAPI